MRGPPDDQGDEFEGWLPLILALIVSVAISALAIFSSFAGWPSEVYRWSPRVRYCWLSIAMTLPLLPLRGNEDARVDVAGGGVMQKTGIA